MDSDSDYEFDQTDSGASNCYPVQCSALRTGGYVAINSRPCKITHISTSKTGKHGHAKAHIVALDIFTSKKCEIMCPTTHNLYVPNVTRTEYMLCSIDDDKFCSLLTVDGSTKDDLKLPDNDVGRSIQDGYDEEKEIIVTVLSAMDNEAIIAVKFN